MRHLSTNTGLSQRITSCALLFLAGMAISASSGCTIVQSATDFVHYNEMTDDFVLGWRNHVWSRQAWIEHRPEYQNHPHIHAFKNGFIDGYSSVASGGNGCPPALPPRCYWSWKYQSPEGQAKVATYFEAFPLGAKAAEEIHDQLRSRWLAACGVTRKRGTRLIAKREIVEHLSS